MHKAQQLRTDWFFKSYLRQTKGVSAEKRSLLDLGVYENGGERRAFLENQGFTYASLPHDFQEKRKESAAVLLEGLRQQKRDAFDLVFSTHALSHAKAPWKVMAEIARVLRPGGEGVFIEPGLMEKGEFRVTPDSAGVEYFVPAFHKHRYISDHYRFDAEALRSMAEDAELTVIHSSMNYGPLRLSINWYSASETVVIVRKPLREAPRDATEEKVNRYSLPMSYLGAFGNSDKNVRLKSVLKRIEKDPFYQRDQEKQLFMYFMGDCSVTVLGLYLQAALPNAKCQFDYFTGLEVGQQIIGVTNSDQIKMSAKYKNADILWISQDITPDMYADFKGQVIRVPRVLFCGYHPDFTNNVLLPARGRTSNIICECFLRGYSEEKALSFFTRDTYARLGYFAAWEAEEKNLADNFAQFDMDLYDFLPYWMRTGVFMRDSLHPADFVIMDIAKYLCKKHGLKYNEPATLIRNTYHYNNKQPIYPEIAEHLGIPEMGSYVFRRAYPNYPPFEWEDSVFLDEYIRLVYAHFRNSPDLASSLVRLEML